MQPQREINSKDKKESKVCHVGVIFLVAPDAAFRYGTGGGRNRMQDKANNGMQMGGELEDSWQPGSIAFT